MRAFTLIEVLIYTGLFSLIILSLFFGLMSTTLAIERSKARALLELEGGFLDTKLAYEIDHAHSIGGTDTRLVLVGKDGNETNIYAADDALLFVRGSTHPLPVSSGQVRVADFMAVHRGQRGDRTDPEQVTVSFTISTRDSRGSLVSQPFTLTRYRSPYLP